MGPGRLRPPAPLGETTEKALYVSYALDRDKQKRKTFTGIDGVSEQDAMIQDSQGVIADRTREHLGPTDAVIIEFRRLILRGARDLRTGVEPAAAKNGEAYRVRGDSIVTERGLSFAEVMTKRFGSVAGMCAARVLSDFVDTVTIVERDAYPASPDFRPGVPQARHVHNLLARGLRELEGFFPGFEQRMRERGAVPVESGWDIATLWPH